MPFDPAARRDRRRAVRGRAPAGRASGGSAVTAAAAADDFSLYVEGPRDGEILRVWARRVSPTLVRPLERCVVILGGRRPARAVEHFRESGGGDEGRRGLVVLDRDHHGDTDALVEDEPGLELFTWSRRHIESYVLVRDAIGRVLSRRDDADWVGRLVEAPVPRADDEAACRHLDAKRLLGAKGPLARALGREVSPAEIARSMHREELHADVASLFSRIRAGLCRDDPGCEVVRRPRPRSR